MKELIAFIEGVLCTIALFVLMFVFFYWVLS